MYKTICKKLTTVNARTSTTLYAELKTHCVSSAFSKHEKLPLPSTANYQGIEN